MANKPLKTIQFPNLPDTYTVPQVDATLSVTGGAADAKVTGDTLAEKADKDGVIATAEGLIGGAYTVEKEPYHFRKTAVDLAGRLDETIVGGSLAWNQLVIATTYTNTNNGITYTYNPDGSVIVNGTATANSYSNIGSTLHGINNHVMVMSGCPSGGSADTYRLRDGYVAGKYDVGNGFLWKKTNDNFIPQIGVDNGVTVSNLKFVPQTIDLTLLFGATIADYIYSLEQATAGAGVAWVKRYIDLDTYHPYDAGSIQSVEGLVSHDMVGFNQWDEETADGFWNDDGTANSSSDYIRCKNKIRVVPGASYYLKAPTTVGNLFTKFYDASGTNAISPSIAKNTVFTIPDGCHYIGFSFAKSAYGTTYNHDICINLSDPSRNGTYEPYEKHSYPLDSSLTLRGVPKLVTDHIEFDGDKYYADGTLERRYGIVDLGSLNWQNVGSMKLFASSDLNAMIRKATANNEVPTWLITSRGLTPMTYYAIQPTTPYAINVSTSGKVLVTLQTDTAYTDVAIFKTAMSGVMLVYELATPTTESAQPYQSPMLVGATEEYVSESVVPVGHESKYYEDVAKKVNGLPKDFSTLIAPTEITFTATRNYSVGSYLIVKNQLYKVTSAISSGGTITPNSNVTATTIMAEILALA